MRVKIKALTGKSHYLIDIKNIYKMSTQWKVVPQWVLYDHAIGMIEEDDESSSLV